MANLIGKFKDKIASGIQNVGRGFENVFEDTDSPRLQTVSRDPVPKLQTVSREPNVTKARVEPHLDTLRSRPTISLDAIYDGYSTAEFDPVAYELGRMTNESAQDDIDALVEKLTGYLEVVSVSLTRNVMKNQDQLVAGVSTVTSVEEDMQVTADVMREARKQVAALLETTGRTIRVAQQARRKKACMAALELCTKVQRAKDLTKTLRKAQESGEYGEAILMCIQSFSTVASLSELKVSSDLRAVVQRSYVDATSRLDNSLTTLCAEFDPVEYLRVLEGYLVQGIQSKHMAEKVILCFKDSINEVSTKVVRSFVIIKAKNLEIMQDLLYGEYRDLCHALAVDVLRPCLQQLLENLYDVLASCYVMAHWHETAASHQATLAPELVGAKLDLNEAGMDAQGLRTNLVGHICSIAESLRDGREEVVNVALWKVKTLLETPGFFKGEGLLQVIGWCQKFCGACEALTEEVTPLREVIARMGCEYFTSYHATNLESLQMLLANEHWRDVSPPAGAPSYHLERAVQQSPLYVPMPDEAGPHSGFNEWILAGNPFRKDQVQASSRKKNMVDLLHKTHGESDMDSPTSTPNRSTLNLTLLAPEDLRSPETGFEASPMPSPSTPAVENSPSRQGLMTIASQQLLKWLKQYAQLMKPLGSGATAAFVSMRELHDNYMLAAFIAFSGYSLADVVNGVPALSTRLREVLLRILTAKGSKYKDEVEEMQRNRPTVDPHTGQTSLFNEVGSKFSELRGDVAGGLRSFATRNIVGKFMDITAGSHSADAHAPAPYPAAAQNAADANPFGQHSGWGPDYNVQGIITSASLFGLQERVVAAESLAHVAEQLRAGKSALLAALRPEDRQESEAWFSHDLEASGDLRNVLFHTGMCLLMQHLRGSDQGIAVLIGATNYAPREPLVNVHPWAEVLLRTYKSLAEKLTAAALPAAVNEALWDQAVALGAESMLDGIAHVRRCTIEGRASMSMDLAHVERGLRPYVAQSCSQHFRRVDTFIKAFFIPWEELARWCHEHMAEYGRAKINMLIDCIADAFKVKRQQKLELMALLDSGASGVCQA